MNNKHHLIMKHMSYLLLLIFLSCQSSQAPRGQREAISYRTIRGYFFRTDRQVPEARYCKIENAAAFDSLFGAAAVMGPGGMPDSIDFSREFLLALTEAESNFETQFIIDSMTSRRDTLTATWHMLQEDSLTFSILSVQLVTVDLKYINLPLVTRRTVVGPN